MSWEGRKSLKDKQEENRDLRRLTVSLMKIRELALLESLEISPSLRDEIILGWSIDEFRGKRRQERVIVNALRDADEEDIETIYELVADPKKAEEDLLERVEQLYNDLLTGDNEHFQYMIEEYDIHNIQYFRQLIRNAKKAESTQKTAPKRKLLEFLHGLIFGSDDE